MTEGFPGQVKFMAGAVLSKSYVAIAARPVVLEDDDDGTRAFAKVDDKWVHRDLDTTVWCVGAWQTPTPSIYWVGRDGHIYINRKGGVREEEVIQDAGHEPHQFGYLFAIRRIGSVLYLCGDAGQVYRRENSGWVHFDNGPLHRGDPLKARAFYSIDGFSEEDIYAVGRQGTLWHYDGRSWTQLPSPSIVDINGVRCVVNQGVYLCGDEGTFFRGQLDNWQRIEVPAGISDIWAIEHFEKTIYLASKGGLFQYDGNRVQRVVTGLKPPPDAFRLDAKDGVLWSFGTRHLCFFDGKEWTYVKHPDNPE